MAAMYALGFSLPEAASAMEAALLRPVDKLSENGLRCTMSLRIRRSGLISGDTIEALLHRLTQKKRLSDFGLPVSLVSVDLVTGETVVFTSQPPDRPVPPTTGRVYITDAAVSEALRASISIPVLFTPKNLGQRMLVDGGVKELVPAYEIRRMGADEVVAADVSSQSDKPTRVSGLVQVLLRTFTIMERGATSRHLASYASLVIQPDTGPVPFPPGPRDVGRLVEAGKRAAYANLERWLTIART